MLGIPFVVKCKYNLSRILCIACFCQDSYVKIIGHHFSLLKKFWYKTFLQRFVKKNQFALKLFHLFPHDSSKMAKR